MTRLVSAQGLCFNINTPIPVKKWPLCSTGGNYFSPQISCFVVSEVAISCGYLVLKKAVLGAEIAHFSAARAQQKKL